MLKLSTQGRKGSTQEQIIADREHARWLRSIRVTPSELAATRAIAERHHKHDFEIINGVTATLVRCKTCPLGTGAFHEWVTSR